MTTITLHYLEPTILGPVKRAYAPTTVFVTDDVGLVYVNPTIIEEDGECVIFIDNCGSERMGTAVTAATVTMKEALYIARRSLERSVSFSNGLTFEWSRGTRKRASRWCVGFRKQRGTRTHLLLCENMDTCLDLAEGRKTITYWTRSRRAEIVDVRSAS